MSVDGAIVGLHCFNACGVITVSNCTVGFRGWFVVRCRTYWKTRNSNLTVCSSFLSYKT